MAKVNVKYECNACGYQSLKYMGRCPNCKKWASMEEVLEAKKATKYSSFEATTNDAERVEAGKLKAVSTQDVPRTLTDSSELNRVLGGGVVGGSPWNREVHSSITNLSIFSKRARCSICYRGRVCKTS